MSKIENAMLQIYPDGSSENIHPEHKTVLLNGIEIDAEISNVIEYLWRHKIKTMRSCQNLNGKIYISFYNVSDALRGGFLISPDGFILQPVPNSHDGGYVSIAIFTSPELIRLNPGFRLENAIYKYLKKELSVVIKPYIKSGLIKAIYAYDDPDQTNRVNRAFEKFIEIGGNMDVAYFILREENRVIIKQV